MAIKSDFKIVKDEKDFLLIQDTCKVNFMSVTNDAENVVFGLRLSKRLKNGQRLYYVDSQGSLDEIFWDKNGFKDFGSLLESEQKEILKGVVL